MISAPDFLPSTRTDSPKPGTVLALCGRAGAGKDTLADSLVSGAGYLKASFAGPLYEEVADAFGVSLETLQNRDTKETPMQNLALNWCSDPLFVYAVAASFGAGLCDPREPRSPRQILQWWGTEYRRSQSVTYWLDKLQVTVTAALREGASVVITDCRFPNEAAMLRREFSAQLWQITRPGEVALTGHPSEATGSAFAPDVVLSNEGTPAEMYQSAYRLLGLGL